MKYTKKIKTLDWLAHNVVRLEVSKPTGFEYHVGDAVEIQVGAHEPGPFTMTNLPSEDTLEFIIRIYKNHHGKTEAISQLNVGDQIGFTEPFNTFRPKENAVFLAGGTGITPFVAIMRYMHQKGTLNDCLLIFSNKTRKDLFLEKELREMLGDKYLNVITSDPADPAYYGNIDAPFLKKQINHSRPVLVCGPPPFNEAMEKALRSIGLKEEHIDLGS
ncbi:MAG: flavodoxin reductase [Marinoscillum sp.]|uniref:flavodoxin reductase n=1 Tax=Marinoscillum sp. TaxID=2024838 RepID=UPI0032FE2C9C